MAAVWRTLAIPVAVAVLLAGCDGCGSNGPWTTRWVEPGAFDRFPAAGARGEWTVTEERPHGPAIPMTASTPVKKWGAGNVSLVAVAWSMEAAHDRISLGAVAAGQYSVSGHMRSNLTSARASDLFTQFARSVSKASEASTATAAKAFAASKQERTYGGSGGKYYTYAAMLGDAGRVPQLYASLERGFAAATNHYSSFANLQQESGAWMFEFALAHKRAMRTWEGRNETIAIDRADQVHYLLGQGLRPDPEPFDAHLRDAFLSLGLAGPRGTVPELRYLYDC